MNTLPLPRATSGSDLLRPRRFAYVGTGGRVKMFLDPVPDRFGAEVEIVALCDSSHTRARYHQARLREKFGYPEVPVYGAADFGQMLAMERPDTVVVCTIDREHDRYIVEALEAGCDVVTEKPMTIDETRCSRILEAVKKTGGRVRVAFNYRWAPGATKVRELLASGIIGNIWQVNMEYLLDTRHGADYFRRWHASKEDSGGLLIHKSTHHFDLVNWWLDAIPEDVFARGGLFFYGRENALRRGDGVYTNYPRYQGHPVDGDPFAYDYNDSMLQDGAYETSLYLSAEAESGYIRDRNVFRDDISIEDVMNVIVQYRSGALLNYSLNAFSPKEGYRVTFTGDRGRIEYEENHGAHILGTNGAGHEHAHQGARRLWVYPHFQPGYQVHVPLSEGDHGGGDALLQEQIFSLHPPRDPYGRSAEHEQGAASILIGIAANLSMAEGKSIAISDLVNLRPGASKLSELL